MTIHFKQELPIQQEPDLIVLRNSIKKLAETMGMDLANQTKLITAASELARNMFIYGGGGLALLEHVEETERPGIRLTFTDQGPGIADLSLALTDGYSTGNSLGLGLPGAKRLVNEFAIQSKPGQGTVVTIIRWKDGF